MLLVNMEQWGSRKYSRWRTIYNNPEVQAYLTKLYKFVHDAVNGSGIRNNPFSKEGRLTRKINDNQFSRLMAIYGNGFWRMLLVQNVDVIGQGQFIFNPLVTGDGDIYFRLSFTGHKLIEW